MFIEYINKLYKEYIYLIYTSINSIDNNKSNTII